MLDFTNIVKARRSIRKFRAEPVPPALIREILVDASWSPSGGNTQPWEVIVVTGELLARLRMVLQKRVRDGVLPNPDVPMPQMWPDAHHKRYQEMVRSILTALGIGRDDEQARNDFTLSMFALYGAPCLLLFCVDRRLSVPYACLDVGLFLQGVCLSAHARGLGTCITAAAVSYPELLRSMLPIGENRLCVIGAVLGYPDWDAPINTFPRQRLAVEDFVMWAR